MVTRNIKIVAQGQADATYADQQKKNGFRLSTAILNGGGSYSAQTLVRNNIAPIVYRYVPTLRVVDLFSPFNSTSWTFNGSASYFYQASPPKDIVKLLNNTRGVAASAFNNNAFVNVTFPFAVSETFRTLADGTSPPNVVDGFSVAFSTLSGFLGGGGGSLGILGGTTNQAVGIVVNPLASFTRIVFNNSANPYPSSSVSLGQITQDICTTNTFVKVDITYDGSNTISWSVSEGATLLRSSQSGINLQYLLGSSNAFLGTTAGSGGHYQTVDLWAASYQAYV